MKKRVSHAMYGYHTAIWHCQNPVSIKKSYMRRKIVGDWRKMEK